jgi:integrase
MLSVRRTVSSGSVVELGKTDRSRRQVPLSPRALGVYEQLPARLDTQLLFPAPHGGLLNLDNFRRREWAPAIEASGVRRPERIYDLRSTFAGPCGSTTSARRSPRTRWRLASRRSSGLA